MRGVQLFRRVELPRHGQVFQRVSFVRCVGLFRRVQPHRYRGFIRCGTANYDHLGCDKRGGQNVCFRRNGNQIGTNVLRIYHNEPRVCGTVSWEKTGNKQRGNSVLLDSAHTFLLFFFFLSSFLSVPSSRTISRPSSVPWR